MVQEAVADGTGTGPTVFIPPKLKGHGRLVLKCAFQLPQVKFMKN